jgi:NAD(P)-dependent dehydrogenase (short-subunit alcohol dehydrogenase family)
LEVALTSFWLISPRVSQLDAAAQTLRIEGHDVNALATDILNANSVDALAQRAAQLGSIRLIAHTAGVSPAQAPVDRIYSVDLLGTAHVIDAFLPVVSPGTSIVVVASLAGHNLQDELSADLESHLARAPATELLSHPDLEAIRSDPTVQSAAYRGYAISKRANIPRVQASAGAWGKKGARINSVSPGFILTPDGLSRTCRTLT